MPYNKITASIPADQLAQIRDEVLSIRQRLDFLVDLTPEERQRSRSLGKKMVAYARQVLALSKENTEYLPSKIDLEALEVRLQLYEDLQAILLYIDPLREGLSDTAIAAGSEVMEEIDILYRLLKEAAKLDATIDSNLQKVASWHQHEREDRQPSQEPETGSETTVSA